MTLINDINGVIGANGDPSRPVKSKLGAFPLGDECPVAGQLLHAVIVGHFCHVNIASAVDGDPIRLSQLPMAASFRSYNAQKGAGRREFFDAPVIRVGDQNISVGINSDSHRRIKLSLVGSSAAFEHGSRTFRQGAELGRRRPGRSRQRPHAVQELTNVFVTDI